MRRGLVRRRNDRGDEPSAIMLRRVWLGGDRPTEAVPERAVRRAATEGLLSQSATQIVCLSAIQRASTANGMPILLML